MIAVIPIPALEASVNIHCFVWRTIIAHGTTVFISRSIYYQIQNIFQNITEYVCWKGTISTKISLIVYLRGWGTLNKNVIEYLHTIISDYSAGQNIL